jgi:RecB family exonuclease
VAQGIVADTDNEPGGGRLVYVGKPTAAGATERQQDPMSLEAAQSWQAQVRQAALDTAGPTFVARVNDSCAHCPVRSDCPAQRAQR